MKTLKLNLLEKKEMNEVRGGNYYQACDCMCQSAPAGQPRNTEDNAKIGPKSISLDGVNRIDGLTVYEYNHPTKEK